MEFTANGVVIKEAASGENAKLLTILTAEHGKIYAYAKGVKKITGKNAPACQLFVYSEFDIVTKGNVNIIKTAVTKELFYNIRNDVVKYSLACYFADVLLGVTMSGENEGETLRLFLNTLYALCNMPEIPEWQIKGAFELRLMSCLGFMPTFSNCFECGSELQLKKSNVFSFEQSGFLCDNCARGLTNISPIPYSTLISDNVLLAMLHITRSQMSKFLSFKLDESYKAEFLYVCERYLLHKTERGFETLKIYKSIVNSLSTTGEQ